MPRRRPPEEQLGASLRPAVRRARGSQRGLGLGQGAHLLSVDLEQLVPDLQACLLRRTRRAVVVVVEPGDDDAPLPLSQPVLQALAARGTSEPSSEERTRRGRACAVTLTVSLASSRVLTRKTGTSLA